MVKHLRWCIICCQSLMIGFLLLAVIYLWSDWKLPMSERFLKQCGQTYFLSEISINNNRYDFDDVLGCNNRKDGLLDCVYSVKSSNLNEFYSQCHILDKLSYSYLNSIKSGQIIHETDMQIFSKYPTINLLLNSTKNHINEAWFKTKKDHNSLKKIYIITSIGNKRYCNANDITETLNKF